MSFKNLFKLFRAVKSPKRNTTARCSLALEALEERQVLTTYDVGPGLAYTSIGAVPWESLGAGDIVQIHWRPDAYREKVMISTSGTAQDPIRVVGIAGPNGELPVLDGQNATTRAQANYPFAGTQDRGLITFTRPADKDFGYKPSYIRIEGLDLRNANKLYTFTGPTGATRTYTDNAASIFVERGEHIVIKDCTLTGSGNGLFTASGDEEATITRDILVTGNDIFGNGNVGSDRHHNVYTAASGIIFEYNHFGDLRAGALGGGLKDRSAGTIIRYNWIEGGARLLDLVDPEDSPTLMPNEPNFRNTYVYGNVFLNRNEDASNLIHYGGDSGVTSNYRKGTLHFYNNTVVIEVNQSQYYNTTLFQPDTNDERVVVDNNIIFVRSATEGAIPTQFNLVLANGTIEVGTNWISPGWLVSSAFGGFQGTITGTNNIIPAANGSNDPGFVDVDGEDFHLLDTSAAVDLSDPVGDALAVEAQYVAVASSEVRPVNGAALDLGAFESTGDAEPVNKAPRIDVPAATSASTTRGTSVTLSVLGRDDGGEAALTYDWSSTGPDTVAFSTDNVNAAKSTVATFQSAGLYTFQVTVRDAEGLTVTSTVTVTVTQAMTSLVVTPSTVTLKPKGKQRFTASARDQFGDAMTKQPVLKWSIAPGTFGAITMAGVYTAPNRKGSVTVRAKSGAFTGTAKVIVSTAKPGTLQFSADNYSVSEDDGTATITVTRTGGSAGAVTVAYATSNNSAQAGIDYTTASGTLTFPAGVTSQTFTVPILGGTQDGTSPALNLTLSSPTGGATLGVRSTAALTIAGNELPGTLQFSFAGYSVAEDAGTASITVTRTGGTGGEVTVQYGTSDNTALAGTDYTATSGTLSFGDGVASRTFTVPILNGTADGTSVACNLILSSPTGGATLGATQTATLTIVGLTPSTKPGSLQFAAYSTSASETAGSATVTVTRTGGTVGAVTVQYATSNDTAQAGTDYTASAGTLTFADGVTTQSFTVPILGGTQDGTRPSLNLTLSNPVGGANLGPRSTAVLTIVGNPAAGTILYVDARNTTGNANGSALLPFTTVQAAVNAASAGTTIAVARGTYQENVIVPDLSVTLRGGFAGGTTADYAGGVAGNFTVFDPGANVTTITAASAQAPVILVQVVNKTVVIEGFTVSGGLHGIYAEGDYQQFGDFTIAHNIIENNGPAQLQVSGDYAKIGGGIYCADATVTITGNIVRNNHANRGGGIAVGSQTAFAVTGNVIEGNTGWDDHGGGVVLAPLPKTSTGTATFSHNLVRNNVASKAYNYGWGGGILVAGENNPSQLKPVTLSYNVWTGNFAPTNGGAIFADNGATVILDHELIYKNSTNFGSGAIYVNGDGGGAGSFMTINDCTIADNFGTGDNVGNGVVVEEYSKVTIARSIFWGNVQDFAIVPGTGSTITATNSDIQQGWPGTGNTSQDPLFLDPESGDYHENLPGGRF